MNKGEWILWRWKNCKYAYNKGYILDVCGNFITVSDSQWGHSEAWLDTEELDIKPFLTNP